jgi:hypothetical protein
MVAAANSVVLGNELMVHFVSQVAELDRFE